MLWTVASCLKGWALLLCTAYGECLPEYKNHVYLDETKKDKWGLPLLNIEMEYGENEKTMRGDMIHAAKEMLESSDPAWVVEVDNPSVPEASFTKWARQEWVRTLKILY